MVTRILARTPLVLGRLEGYTEAALDMENTMRDKMSALTSLEFEGMLHPIFEEDEITLIIVGAVLGVAIGLGQWQIIGV